MILLEIFIIASLVVAALGIGFAVFYSVIAFITIFQVNRKWASHGLETEAEVIQQEIKRMRRGAPLYFIHYRYHALTPQGKQEFTHIEQVWFFEYERYPVGTKLRICYLPESPQTAIRAEKVVKRR